ncbi:hypothetical protein BN13_1360001 [Nostocoides jenkinsii Ben 74]|uniref:Uncharacterized protein n=1 Tax=Nostocoides jenkinsii Ben 74 TaxID=1193518 RepID=A0A077MB03_9MICO|nr:hypothetical protein BN13_1360001 [Tetrasphaera jenkinsii Ben 74]
MVLLRASKNPSGHEGVGRGDVLSVASARLTKQQRPCHALKATSGVAGRLADIGGANSTPSGRNARARRQRTQ